MSLYLPIAHIPINLALLLGMGLAIGILSGMFGVGGGFIMTPLLMFLGVPPAVAVGTGASQVVAASVSGVQAQWYRGNVDVKMGAFLIAGGIAGVILGIKIQQLLKALGQLDLFISLTYVVMLGVIGGLMLIESLRALRKAKVSPTSSTRRAGQHTWAERLPFKQRFVASKLYVSAIPPLVIGSFVGLLTAIMGIGGGFVLIPALIYMLRMPTRTALGTSGFQIIFVTAFATILQATQNHSVDLLLAVPLMVGGVIGAQFGVQIGQRMGAEQLRALLAILVLAVALRMSFDLVAPPSDRYNLEVVTGTSG
ncbi:MAG: sulfite exporter TauE/SafE family protein [Hyphomicrobiaceae bacterium]|jgi:uncharacterized membrane protein YfcA